MPLPTDHSATRRAAAAGALALAAALASSNASAAAASTVHIPAPEFDVWMYPPGAGLFSPFAATFAAPFGTTDPNRFGYLFVGFNTAGQIPANPADFVLTELSFTVRLLNSSTFDPSDGIFYDPTLDPLSSYTGGPDADPGRPFELYAAQFMNGFTLASWRAAGAPVGPPGNYNAQPIDLDPAGTPRIVFNSVDDAIEANPFAVGTTLQTYTGPGGTIRVADGATITFSVDLTQPAAEQFWRQRIAEQRFGIIISSLHAAGFSGFGGDEIYPRLGTDNTFGNYRATATITVAPPPSDPCTGDLNNDGTIDSDDLGILLGAFGSSNAGDLNNDNTTNSDDLGILLGVFGSACP